MPNEERYSARNTKLAYAIGPADLTQWDNAQAALVVGELNSIDHFLGGQAFHTFPKSTQINTLPAQSSPYRVVTGRYQGSYTLNFLLQTGILSYLVFGACTTTEATPNTHAITVSTGQDPIRFAWHLEHEVTTNSHRRDMLGHVPQTLTISCSEQEGNELARQSVSGMFSYSNLAASDLTVPSPLAVGTHRPYQWTDLINGGTSNVINFLYNTGAIGVDIVGVTQTFTRNGGLSQKDANGYPLTGKFTNPMTWSVTLSVIPKDSGTSIFDIWELAHTSYAGDLDLVLNYKESTSRYLQFTYDKLYLDPNNEEAVEESKWHEGYDITLTPLNENSSVVIEEKNALNNDYYENPA